MSYFNDQFYNPAYFNPINYQQMRYSIPTNQNERGTKAVHAFCDMLDQVEGMDANHQKQTLLLCLSEMARRNKWD